MANEAIYEAMFENTVRIEEMWPFPMSPAPERLIEAIAERMEDERLPEPIAALMAGWSEEEKDELYDGGCGAEDAFGELCAAAFRRGLFGFIGIAATPVMTPYGDGTAKSFSWGHYNLEMLFAPTADELIGEAVKWAEDRRAAETAEAETA